MFERNWLKKKKKKMRARPEGSLDTMTVNKVNQQRSFWWLCTESFLLSPRTSWSPDGKKKLASRARKCECLEKSSSKGGSAGWVSDISEDKRGLNCVLVLESDEVREFEIDCPVYAQ